MSALRIRLAGYQPARSILTRGLYRIAETLRERLGAQVEIVLTDSVIATGRRADDLLAMVEGDELDICYFSSSYLTSRVPSLGHFDQPFRFADRAAAHAELAGPQAQRLAEDVAGATGFRLLGLWDNGIRHISNRRHPIRRTADCQGLRIRTVNNADHQAFFRRLGFEPVFIDISDLPRAIADGTVDAQENPLTNIVNFEMQRHHRFVSLTGHLFGVAVLLVNRRRFDGWPAEVRTAVATAATVSTAAQRKDAEAEDEVCLRRLVDDGVDVIPADDIDRAAFVAAAGLPDGPSGI
jgi:TRAP-type C4-dicarboxylate transport system substrate-binding protein